MRNLRMTVAYVGTGYAGWQVQPRLPTIQGVLEERLSAMLGERIRIVGAGRTDAGVHARGQVANFSTAGRIPPDGLRRGINARLPESIRVLQADEVSGRFNARADARWKEYRYRFFRGEVMSPFDAPFASWVFQPLDVAAMRRAAGRLVGRHDFTSFCAAGCRVEDRTRTILASEVIECGPFVEYRVRADGFLQHMVRTLAGTLLLAGRRRLLPEAIDGILEARDRRRAGPCAPARGLVLEKVQYGEGP